MIRSRKDSSIIPLIVAMGVFLILSGLSCDKPTEDHGGDNGEIEEPEDTLWVGGWAVFDVDPTWSIKGWIAYEHDRGIEGHDPDQDGIYLIREDGSDKHLFHDDPYASFPAWSPDGEYLLFTSQGGVVKMPLSGEWADTLTIQSAFEYPCWSPDGKYIAFSYEWWWEIYYGIWILKAEGDSLARSIPSGRDPHWPYPDSIVYRDYSSMVRPPSICITHISGEFKRVIFEPDTIFIADSINPVMHRETRKVVFDLHIPDSISNTWII
ncbi:MAG: hypothetical protein GF315_03505, partial [candidate division Zixibacteria bacterium]|nr:hypothetical protein [candidate division Zixibacteria bacterium]